MIWLYIAITVFIIGDAAIFYWLWRSGKLGGRRRSSGWPDKGDQ
jgi:hypothetical protein